MASRQPPEQQAPPVQKLRIKYAKRGRARFTSHRDFGRAFERALRRAGVPMAYSSGFSPHPRISYANASPTGAASESEFVEIGLAAICAPERVREALDAALPPGLDIVAVWEAGPGALADQLTGSRWRVDLDPAAASVLPEALAEFLDRPSVTVERMTKNGVRTFDARGAVVDASAGAGALELTLAHLVPLVRPDDVLSALTQVQPSFTPAPGPLITRLAQGRLDPATGEIADPSDPTHDR